MSDATNTKATETTTIQTIEAERLPDGSVWTWGGMMVVAPTPRPMSPSLARRYAEWKRGMGR